MSRAGWPTREPAAASPVLLVLHRWWGGATRVFPVQSTCGIPTAAEAYSLRDDGGAAGALGVLNCLPDGQSLPVAATLNDRGGEVLGNQAIVPARHQRGHRCVRECKHRPDHRH